MEQIFAWPPDGQPGLYDIAAKMCLLILAITAKGYIKSLITIWRGDPTPRLVGLASPNPGKHIEMLGSIFLPLLFLFMTQGQFTIGSGKQMELNDDRLKSGFNRLIVALSGPIVYGILALIGLGLMIAASQMIDMHIGDPLYAGLQAFCFMCLLLAAFDLVPIPPWAGSEVVRFVLPGPTKKLWDGMGRWGIGMIVFLVIIFTDEGSRALMGLFSGISDFIFETYLKFKA